MTAYETAILCFTIGIVLVLAEALLPTQGIVGVIGGIVVAVGVGFLFAANASLGLGAAVGLLVVTPVALRVWMKLWPKTPVGRRLVLAPGEPGGAPERLPRVGESGTTVSELRPMGITDFAGTRCETRSEHGLVRPGTVVRVIGFADGVATVRPL